MTADEDTAELFYHLMAQITASLEGAATLASNHQAEKALVLARAAQTIVDRT